MHMTGELTSFACFGMMAYTSNPCIMDILKEVSCSEGTHIIPQEQVLQICPQAFTGAHLLIVIAFASLLVHAQASVEAGHKA